ncbi:hypothetical protein E3Q22_01009 [Wallemia mellicola]|uniref:Xylanolytic transcriptional activator regulatory domain-containing protein n=1 Tax=Wallemia mellicola TaxID=1708541 RepID=A0A4T0SAZ7_9BASI|nr:hypothetical protein E3Q23_00619 [Wallemia mellicola]TIB81504.1 hypothetical protein E3Q22_01009 [Wallemia mellicola]TIC01118.1 hypothetical protein E3Q18_00791 [Wallemia mellicola]TIC04709.1 hypothetical protein E3Q17_00276 [Wallemia mellicola]TIC07336.1 hypothetical protein E3Q16_00573 [Wallemia mellicola]
MTVGSSELRSTLGGKFKMNLSYSQQLDSYSQQTPQQLPQVPPGGRPFRSRRRSKTRCFITESGPPCNECKQTNKPCTFQEAPAKRKRKPPQTEQDQNIQPGPPTTSQPVAGPVRNRKRGTQPQTHQPAGSLDEINFTPYIPSDMSSLSNVFASLDLSTPESHEPHLVSSAPDDISNLLPPGPSLVRQLSLDPNRPVFAVFERKPHYRSSLDPGLALLSQVDQVLAQCDCSRDQLIQNYLSIVHPAYPVLPDGNQTTPPYLLGAIYSSALIFTTDQTSIPINAWAILHVATHPDFDKPKLSTIAANLLDLNGRPSMDPRGNYLVLARTVAQAQLLGLHLDPTDWSIPSWERDLRIRLWWGCVIHSSSIAVYENRPTHISPADTDVPLPSLNSLPQPSSSARSFRGMCALCHLLVRTHEALVTVRAKRQKTRQEKLQIVFVLEHEAEKFYNESIPLEKSPGTLSFQWEIMGLRLFLRKQALEFQYHGQPLPPPDNQSMELVNMMVDFLSTLTESDIRGYWLIYAANHFTLLLTMLIRLCFFSKESAMTPFISQNTQSSPLGLLAKYSLILQSTAKNYKWDLVHKALEKAADVMVRLRKYHRADILLALEGKYVYEPSHMTHSHSRSASFSSHSNNNAAAAAAAVAAGSQAAASSQPGSQSQQTTPKHAASGHDKSPGTTTTVPVKHRAGSLDYNFDLQPWDPNNILSTLEVPTAYLQNSPSFTPTFDNWSGQFMTNTTSSTGGVAASHEMPANLLGIAPEDDQNPHEVHLNTMATNDPFYDDGSKTIGSLHGW